MSYNIDQSVWSNMFALPTQIPDKYIKMANETQIKAILWIFRHSGEEINAAEIAKHIGKSSAAVEESLCYWASVGVLKSDNIPLAQDAVSAVSSSPQKVLQPIPETKPSYEQIKTRCKESPELELLFNDVQKRLGRTIGYEGEYTILMMHDSYGLPLEVILMLVDYCVSMGKSSYAYMKKVAQNWGEREIDSIEKADALISKLNTCQSTWTKFCSMTGIQNPKPTSSQAALLLKWVGEYKFSAEMIYLAYEEMSDNCSRTSFKYMDEILKNWFLKGIKNPEDAEREKQQFKKSRAKPKAQVSASTGSYDMDEFERRAQTLPVYKRKKGDDK